MAQKQRTVDTEGISTSMMKSLATHLASHPHIGLSMALAASNACTTRLRMQQTCSPSIGVQCIPKHAQAAGNFSSLRLVRTYSFQLAQGALVYSGVPQHQTSVTKAHVFVDETDASQHQTLSSFFRSILRIVAVVGVAAITLLSITDPAFAAHGHGTGGRSRSSHSSHSSSSHTSSSHHSSSTCSSQSSRPSSSPYSCNAKGITSLTLYASSPLFPHTRIGGSSSSSSSSSSSVSNTTTAVSSPTSCSPVYSVPTFAVSPQSSGGVGFIANHNRVANAYIMCWFIFLIVFVWNLTTKL